MNCSVDWPAKRVSWAVQTYFQTVSSPFNPGVLVAQFTRVKDYAHGSLRYYYAAPQY